jgi:uncharacterized protein YecT (DUF1311 family)
MPFSVGVFYKSRHSRITALAAVFLLLAAVACSDISASEMPKLQGIRGPMQPAPPQDSDAQAPQAAQTPQAQAPPPAAEQPDEEPAPKKAAYDAAIFQPTMTSDQIAFLKRIGHVQTAVVAENSDFHKLLKSVVPNCMFHYGRDMPLMDALDTILEASTDRAEIRDSRYLILTGDRGPYLQGKAFLWFDMQSGIALGGFYFRPTNGEPTPTLAVFSKQVKDKYLEMSQLPTEFAVEVNQWSGDRGVPPVLTRYFLTGGNKRVLLVHDEDYCSAEDSVSDPSGRDCEQINADAADMDVTAAYYLELTHNATNATEWMALGEDQVAWIQVRDNTCGAVIDPLGCRIRMAHRRTRAILALEP